MRAIALLVLIAGCADEGPLGHVAPIAVLKPTPGTELSFDTVVLGRTKAGPLIVTTKNEGDSPLIVGAHVESEGPIRVSSVNKRVEPTDSGEVFVRFEPVLHGDSSTVLVVETNDPKLPEARYPIRGSAREPCYLSAWPYYQRFMLGETREVTIYNDSKSACDLTRIFMEGEDLFSLVDAPEVPYQIPAGGELTLRAMHTTRTELPGAPIRQLHLKEKDGSEIIVTFEGALPIWSCLGVYPRTLTFPDTDLGVRGRANVTVYSACDEPAIIHTANVGIGYYFFDVDQTQFPIIVPPFGEAQVAVDYLPYSELGDAGRLTVSTNDAANRKLRVHLEGKAVIPELLTIPAIDFGSAVPGCSEHVEKIPLLAIGEARSIITSLSVEGDPAFTIEGVQVDGVSLADPTPPITIMSGSSAHVLVRFAPSRADPPDHRAELVVLHNGRDFERRIALFGNAVSMGPTTETFTAPAVAPVDVLWVIDDSRSMESEEDRLQAAMPSFVNALVSDYQIAMIAGEEETRSPGWPYSCPPHPYVVDDTYSDPLTALTCSVRIGYSSEKRRAAFGAAIRGLHRGIDPTSDPNPLPTFLRKDAELAVLIVSDEDDQSRASDVAFRDFLYSVKGSYRPDRVAVHAIAGDPDVPCASDPWLIPGERYRRVARETGGLFESVCSSDFSPILSGIAGAIFAPRHRFDLDRPADPLTLMVTVDGAPIAEDPLDGYTFDAQANAVRLHGASQPAAGALVSITYGDACR